MFPVYHTIDNVNIYLQVIRILEHYTASLYVYLLTIHIVIY